jgi:hypothetical protein
MTGFDPSQKFGHAVPAPLQGPGAGTQTAKPQTAQSGGFFHHLWDVINPLQHLPGISAVYRAVTGEHIGTFERIAGDTLYGGLWGAVSSVADTVFAAVTGKDFGDTVMSLFVHPHDQANKDGDAAAAPQPAAASGAPPAGDTAALSNAMQAKGVDSDLAQRALYAYRKSMALPDAALAH